MKTRVIKIQPKYTPRDYDRSRKVPMLTLSGVWLEQAGFNIHEHVQIEVSENQLLIKRREV